MVSMERFALPIYDIAVDAALKVPSETKRLKNSEHEKPLNEQVCCQKELHLYHLFVRHNTQKMNAKTAATKSTLYQRRKMLVWKQICFYASRRETRKSTLEQTASGGRSFLSLSLFYLFSCAHTHTSVEMCVFILK